MNYSNIILLTKSSQKNDQTTTPPPPSPTALFPWSMHTCNVVDYSIPYLQLALAAYFRSPTIQDLCGDF
jgi:hypothetical protein